MAELTYIYALVDRDLGEVRYVGKATAPAARLRQHWRARHDENTHKAHWLRSLDEPPLMVVLEECAATDWAEREMWWIAHYIEQGRQLTNITPGGEGGPGMAGMKHTPEAKAAISAAMKGRVMSDEWRQRIAEGVSRAQKGVPKSEAAKASMKVSYRARLEKHGPPNKKGNKFSEESKAKMRASQQARRAREAQQRAGVEEC